MPCLIPGCIAAEASEHALVSTGPPLFSVPNPGCVVAEASEGALLSVRPSLFAAPRPAADASDGADDCIGPPLFAVPIPLAEASDEAMLATGAPLSPVPSPASRSVSWLRALSLAGKLLSRILCPLPWKWLPAGALCIMPRMGLYGTHYLLNLRNPAGAIV